MCYQTYIICYDGRLKIIIKKNYFLKTHNSHRLAQLFSRRLKSCILITFPIGFSRICRHRCTLDAWSKSNRDRIYSFVSPKLLSSSIQYNFSESYKITIKLWSKKTSEIDRVFSSLYRNRYTLLLSKVTWDTYILCALQQTVA